MTAATVERAGSAPSLGPEQGCHLIYRDGSERFEVLSAEMHATLWTRTVHGGATGLVEVASAKLAGDGRYVGWTADRKDPEDYILADRAEAIAARALGHAAAGCDVFAGPAPRAHVDPSNEAVEQASVVWVDVDDVDDASELTWVDTLRPHVLVRSGGGFHAYWRLAQSVNGEQLRSLNRGLVAALGQRAMEKNEEGRRPGVDFQSTNPARVMRVPGTVNTKNGRWCRLMQVDLARPLADARRLAQLMPDPKRRKASKTRRRRRVGNDYSLEAISPPEYFERLCGVSVPASGWVRCPLPDHEEEIASCQVWEDAARGFYCHGCGKGGDIYSLAAYLDGQSETPRGEQFVELKRGLKERFGLDEPKRKTQNERRGR